MSDSSRFIKLIFIDMIVFAIGIMMKAKMTALKYIWPASLALPLVIVLLIQIPLCKVLFVSHFFENLPPARALQILTCVFIVPSYGLLGYAAKNYRKKLLHLALLTAVFIPYLPLLWVMGFYTSRLLFAQCS